MRLVSRLERKFGRYAIPNLTMLIIAGQVLLYLLWKIERALEAFRQGQARADDMTMVGFKVLG